jgi:hypothetical protein
MKPNAVFDYTEVNFAGKQYKFIKEAPAKPAPKPRNRRSKSVLSPIIEDISAIADGRTGLPADEALPEPPKSPANFLVFDPERVKQFSQLPSDQYRIAHVDLLSPFEERRVREVLKMQPKSVEVAKKKQQVAVIREAGDIKNVFKYFNDIKLYNSHEGRTSRLPRFRMQPTARLSLSHR